ncbi:MAG: phosphatidate cytidylyltransferase [Puniceicoccales bacterium]|jgi:phosphatidate cytidylyltransferase|nr:phosphatidate cytidylyltransferase [Puniceicoccales bacterium]
MMKKRILSTAVLWAMLIVALMCFKTRGCWVLLIVASALTQYEFYKLLQRAEYKPLTPLGIVCGIAMQVQRSLNPSESLVVVAVIIACCAFAKRSMRVVRESLLPTILGVMYVPFMFMFSIIFADEMQTLHKILPDTSLCTLLLLIAVIKFSDVGGMCFGSMFGRHKLAPDFSPNKTLEGLIGGVIASIAVGLVIFFPFKNFLIPSLTLRHVILLSGILSIIAVLGDLVESTIKRMAGVKDSGNIVPGIGGMFDLTDSLILALPIGIFYIKYIVL